MNANENQIKSLLNRMWNWKMESAYNVAKGIKEFPPRQLARLKTLSKEFGNCGWQEGDKFDKLRDANNKIAEALGYTWDDDADKWVKREHVTA